VVAAASLSGAKWRTRRRRSSGSSDRRCMWQRKRMRGILWIRPADHEDRRRPAKSDAWGQKGPLSSLLPPRWVLVGGRQRKEGGQRGRGGAGSAGETWWPAVEQRGEGTRVRDRRRRELNCLSGKLEEVFCKKDITSNNSDWRE
jgi:hypothetical protein